MNNENKENLVRLDSFIIEVALAEYINKYCNNKAPCALRVSKMLKLIAKEKAKLTPTHILSISGMDILVDFLRNFSEGIFNYKDDPLQQLERGEKYISAILDKSQLGYFTQRMIRKIAILKQHYSSYQPKDLENLPLKKKHRVLLRLFTKHHGKVSNFLLAKSLNPKLTQDDYYQRKPSRNKAKNRLNNVLKTLKKHLKEIGYAIVINRKSDARTLVYVGVIKKQ